MDRPEILAWSGLGVAFIDASVGALSILSVVAFVMWAVAYVWATFNAYLR
jgi:hypothetical protein